MKNQSRLRCAASKGPSLDAWFAKRYLMFTMVDA